VVFRPLPAAPLVVCCMYLAVVPRPMPSAIASRYFRCRFQQLVCSNDKKVWRAESCLKSAATLSQQEKNNSSVVQRGTVNIA
jgi:hypothetical protein